jgi:hypothetical protein
MEMLLSPQKQLQKHLPPDIAMAGAQWGCYSSPGALDGLLDWLNPKGKRMVGRYCHNSGTQAAVRHGSGLCITITLYSEGCIDVAEACVMQASGRGPCGRRLQSTAAHCRAPKCRCKAMCTKHLRLSKPRHIPY